jgi:two-component system LytT family response regulator
VIRAVIADDEPLARRMLRDLLAPHADIAIAGECCDGPEAVEALGALAPDLVFLDIRMPGLDGFAALRAAPHAPVVVFVTAHADRALEAFDASATDYLLKPFDDERFARSLARARAEIERRRIVERRDRLAVKDGAKVELVDPAEIDWIGAEGYYAELHLGRRSLLLREPMQDLESRLDRARFVRIHRSTIVNVERVRRIEPVGHGEAAVILADGTRLRASRGRRAELGRMMRR